MGFSSARRMFEQQLMNMSRTLHSGQCLVMLSLWFHVLRKASHLPGKMNWVGTFPFELPYSNPELIRDYAGNTRSFTDFVTFIDCVKSMFLHIPLTSCFFLNLILFIYLFYFFFDRAVCSQLIHQFTFPQTLNISSSSNSI